MGSHYKTEAGKGGLNVKVQGDNFEKAIRTFKKKIMTDGILKELKSREAYESKGQRRRREKQEARRRHLKTLSLQNKFGEN